MKTLSALVLFLLPLAVAAQPTASDVFEEVERRQNLVTSESASLEMEIVDERGRTRTRAMDLRTKLDDGQTKSILVFTGPADIRGMGLLTVETGSGDDQRLYLPALGRVQRIAGSKRGERFAGSDFTYEDLGTRDPDQYDVEMLETTDDTFVFEARPKDDDSEYSRIVLTVDSERYVIQRAEHFDRGGNLAKVLTATEFAEVASGSWRANQLTMEDVQANRRTVLTFSDRDTGATLSDGLFTERQLQRGLR